MRRSPRLIVRAPQASALMAGPAAVDVMITEATHVSRASRAGNPFHRLCIPSKLDGLSASDRRTSRYLEIEICHEADQRLPSARKNKKDNRSSAIKQSAELSENRKSRKAVPTNCVR